jgi:predicted nucleotidyltransferase component of viral defense system
MNNNSYYNQASLLLRVIPEIAKDKRFALHGGTAINMFVRNMPRLSVDIDLTYLPIENREQSFAMISAALLEIRERLNIRFPALQIQHKVEIHKLIIANRDAIIKVEVSPIIRGSLGDVSELQLSEKAQNNFDTFCEMQVVSIGQLYGGKICAAMDRQHPRDLFDIKYLLQNEGFTSAIKEGFLFRLLSSERSIQDVLFPKLQDQRLAFQNQFSGMSPESFSYEEYEQIRETLIQKVHQSLTDADKSFLIRVKNAEPDWSIYDFLRFPSIQWKQQNLTKMKATNPLKHKELTDSLRVKLDRI